jgi:segregation and condensation protein B
LSRAMMETLAIVAYRQPITRPEIDDIRGVDCGPVLRTLLDRNLVRVIGKKEEVGRPLLYGTTPEFLKTFSLKDLADLPTLREFHELGAAERAEVDAQVPAVDAGAGGVAGGAAAAAVADLPPPGSLPDYDRAEEDALLDEIEQATVAASRATRAASRPGAPGGDEEGEGDGQGQGNAAGAEAETAATASGDGERDAGGPGDHNADER